MSGPATREEVERCSPGEAFALGYRDGLAFGKRLGAERERARLIKLARRSTDSVLSVARIRPARKAKR